VDHAADIQSRYGIVGRAEELRLALAVLAAGSHLLLEGPVGVGKTTVALAVCRHLGKSTIRVDGDERYTENKLTGWFDPPLVLKTGYGEGSFLAGPLVRAMREGAVLFINELNRMPESVQNVLLPALDERLLILPRIGEVRAAPGFQVVATQNPVEYIATGHLSEALKDRFEHIPLRHQGEDEERQIVRRVTGSSNEALVSAAVAVVRQTRCHPRLRKGASVRAASGIVSLAERLDGAPAASDASGASPGGVLDSPALRSAALASLATRVELRDEEGVDPADGLAAVVDEIISIVKKN
jgi:MoxR-like ATPase